MSEEGQHFPVVEQGPGMLSFGVFCPCGYSTGFGLRERKAREIMHKHAGHVLTTTAVRAPGYGFTGGWGIDAECSCGERRQDPVSHRMSAVIWHDDHLTEVYAKGSQCDHTWTVVNHGGIESREYCKRRLGHRGLHETPSGRRWRNDAR